MEELYRQELELLESLKNTNLLEQQEAIKNIIGRINEEMREIEEENKKPPL
jgi:hypothetical protein